MEDLTGQVDTVDSIEAAEWNNFYQEFKNFIEAFVTMNVGDLTQFRKVGTALTAQGQWTEASGGSVAYTLAMNTGIIAPIAYATGQVFQFRANVNSTVGSNTVNVGGLGAKSIVREDGGALQLADLSTGRDSVIRYDGTKFFLMDSSLGDMAAGDLPQKYIFGLTMGRSGSEPATEFRDIEVQVGQCRSQDNTKNLSLGGLVTKRFDASFAFGSGVGGYANGLGARTVDTWYRFFIIGRTTGAVDFGWDSDANDDASQLLADANTAQGDSTWQHHRQLGWVRTTAASADELIPFSNFPSDPSTFRFTGIEPKDDFLAGGSPLANGLEARRTEEMLYAPPDSTALIKVMGYNRANSGGARISALFMPIGHPDVAPTVRDNHIDHRDPGRNAGTGTTPFNVTNVDILGDVEVQVDSVSEYHSRWITNASNGYAYIVSKGFRFER